MFIPNKMIRVGTDCSGIEAPIQALKQLKIPFSHEFSSDIDKYVIQSIKANYNPKILYGDPEGPFPDGDISKRNNKKLPDIDLYICGFPCQTFSTAGKRKGFKDKRGQVFWSCIDVIKKKKPHYFILENVKGLVSHNKGKTWDVIWNEMKKLSSDYNVYWTVLNTKDYGIPQNRERVFIVGSKNDDFEWPKKCKMKKLESYIDWRNTKQDKITIKQEKIIKKVLKNNKNSIFIDFNFSHNPFSNSDKYVSTINTMCSNMFCIPLNRKITFGELLSLQGFPKKFKQVVSKSQFKKQIGNSMSVNVLKKIIHKLLNSETFK
jgi:DNA (cytosine-5)-methyltransferase 1